MTTLSYAL